MLSNIFLDPLDWDADIAEIEREMSGPASDTSGSPSNSLEAPDVLSHSLPCPTISTVSMSKHVAAETGKEIWMVDKVCKANPLIRILPTCTDCLH
jgi:hypothetical protein